MRNVALVILTCLTCGFLVETISGSPSRREKIAINSSLAFIIDHPINKGRPASFLLGPPLSEEEIIRTLQPVLDNKYNSNLEQLIQLYEWTDGISTSLTDDVPVHELWIIPGYYLMSLKEAVDILLTMRRVTDFWNPAWLPVFSSRAGDFIVIDLTNGRIFEIFTKESLGWETARSTEEFVQQLAQNLKSGKIFIDEHGLMDVKMTDDGASDKEKEIVQKSKKSSNMPVDEIFHRINISPNFSNRKVSEMNDDQDVQQPNLVFNCTRIPNVCANIANAINNNGKPRRLQRTTDINQIIRNRQASCGHIKCPIGQSCDEYPFASTFQGGIGATVMCVPAVENNSQGGQLNIFYNRNGVSNGTWFDQTYP